MKYIKLFEDYSKFNTDDVEYHRSNDFYKEEEKNIRDFAKSKGYNLGEIIGIGFGGVAFDMGSKVLKYTYDDIEVSASDFLINKKTEYFANVYEITEFERGWIIIMEKLDKLSDDNINDLKNISSKLSDSPEYNLDKLNMDSEFYNDLSDSEKVLYTDLINMRKESDQLGFDLIDCKIDNLGIKNGHIAMFDVKESGY